MNAVIGWVEWIIRMGGELSHGEICNIHEMFAVMVALIYREALFDIADVIVLCAAYLGLKRSVAEVAHNHAVFAVFLDIIGHIVVLKIDIGSSEHLVPVGLEIHELVCIHQIHLVGDLVVGP